MTPQKIVLVLTLILMAGCEPPPSDERLAQMAEQSVEQQAAQNAEMERLSRVTAVTSSAGMHHADHRSADRRRFRVAEGVRGGAGGEIRATSHPAARPAVLRSASSARKLPGLGPDLDLRSPTLFPARTPPRPHTAHYGGAIKGYVAADARIEESAKIGQPIDAAAYATLKRAVNSKGNSVVLHELYFDGLAPDAPDPAAGIRAAIEQRFGSAEKWAADFIASAKEAAGWAMLVQHPMNGKLYNVVSDEHAMGVLWMATPLVVIDTYEQAFYIDYQNRKAEYMEKFMDHIDWNEANLRHHASRR